MMIRAAWTWKLPEGTREELLQNADGAMEEWDRDFIRTAYAGTVEQTLDLIAVEMTFLLDLCNEVFPNPENREKRFQIGCCLYLLEDLKARLVREERSPDDEMRTT